ncbi:IPT/TIG domain-containing protein [Burkholderia sp. 22PA0099]|uniref:IPT/TIG domain-containing protein n=1 Tax=Burkholderia sp. 22PA0099 TaxID=3237372 RepID=UPI0039C342B7
MSGVLLRVVALMFAVLAYSSIFSLPSQAAVQFAYDLSGRLVQATDDNGAAVQYQYDAAGNLLGVQQVSSGSIAITTFAPITGPVGTLVTISGAGFDATASNNSVTIGGVSSQVVSATNSQLVVSVPAGAVTGPIVVSDSTGSATSQSNFIVGSLLGAGGAAVPVNAAPGSPATITFAGNAGDGVTLTVSGLATGGTVQATVTQPNGASLASCSSVTSTMMCTLPLLPATGTYTLTLSESTGTTGGSVQIVPDMVGGLLTANASNSYSATVGNPAVQYTFAASNGESDLALTLGSDSIAGNTTVFVYDPNGNVVTSSTVTSTTVPAQLNLGALSGGTYRVRVIPGALIGGVLQSTLLQLTGSASLVPGGGAAAVNLVTGQSAVYSFNGVKGQNLGIGISLITMSPTGGGVSLALLDSNKTQIWSAVASSPGGWALPTLPASDTYTLTVNPGTASASFNLRLTVDQNGALPIDGSLVDFSPTTIGLNASDTFQGVAGQSYSLTFLGNTFAQSVNIYVIRPDGVQWMQGTVYSWSRSSQLSLPNTPLSGTYTVRIVPTGPGLGTLSLALSPNASSTLSIDAGPVTGAITPGQTATYSFSGTQGQLLGVGLTNYSTIPTGQPLTVTLYDSSGVTLNSCTVVLTDKSHINASSCPLPALPVTDTYSLSVSAGNNGASFVINLVSDQAATLSSDGTPSVLTTGTVGQNGAFTFPAQAGQNYVISFGANTIVATTSAALYNPDGTLNTSIGIVTGDTGQISLTPAIANANYLIRVVPNGWDAQPDSISVSLAASGSTTIGNNVIGALSVGSPTTVNATNGQTVAYTFSGTQGEYAGLGFTNFSGPGANVVVTNSSGSSVSSFSVSGTTGYAMPMLSKTDTYTVAITAGAGTTSFDLTLLPDQTGTLAVNSANSTFSTTAVGQNASYSFAVAAGQTYTLAVPTDTFAGNMGINVYLPDGTRWTSLNSTNPNYPSTLPAYYTLPSAPVSGTYSVRFTPDTGATGGLSVGIMQTVSAGSLTPGSAPNNVVIQGGQSLMYTFNGSQGEMLGVGLANIALNPNSLVNLAISNSSGVQVWSGNTYYGASFAIPPLPATDTYKLTLSAGSGAGTFDLYFTDDVAASLQVNGAVSQFNSTIMGQNATYSFSATAGQRYAVSLSSNSHSDYVNVQIYKPDGAILMQYSLWPWSAAEVDLGNAPASGTYLIRTVPGSGTSGSLSVGVAQSVTGAITPGAAPIAMNLASGQTANYTFSGTQGEALGVGLSSLSTNPVNGAVTLTLYGADGMQLWTNSTSGTAGFALPYLPASGIYTLSMNPGAAAATFNVQLTQDQSSVFAVNGATATFVSNEVGQNATYTFSATAGGSYAVSLTGDTHPDYVNVFVYKPDGSQWQQYNLWPYWGTVELELSSVPTDGTYVVRVVPAVGGSGSLSIGIGKSITSGLTPGGSAVAVNMAAGQDLTYTFNGSQGQSLGVGISNFSTVPGNASISVTLLGPDGENLWSGKASSDAGFGLPVLSVSGTYSLVFSGGGSAATYNLQLTQDQIAPFAVNEAPSTFTSTTVGQNATYTFAATAGQSYSLALTGDTHPDLMTYSVYKPDGSLWVQHTLYPYWLVAQIDLTNAPVSGTYTVRLVPDVGSSGAVTVGLGATSTSTIEPGQNAQAVNLAAGQTLGYTFNGSKGALFGVGLTNLAFNSPGTKLALTLIGPDGEQLWTFGATGDGGVALPVLPQDGTYTLTFNAGGSAASFNLQLTPDQVGTLALGTSQTFVSSVVGQNMTYSFLGTAGGNYVVSFTGDSHPDRIDAYAYKPDGTLWQQVIVWANDGDHQLALSGAPVDGAYTLRLVPTMGASGSLITTVTSTGNSTSGVGATAITPSATPFHVSLTAGQTLYYSFSGNQGDALGVGFMNSATTPGGAQMTYTLTNSSGTVLSTDYISVSHAWEFNLPILPANDTYTLALSAGSASAEVDVVVVPDTTATLDTNGTPVTFADSPLGLNGSYTFSGVAGQSYSIALSNDTFYDWQSLTVNIYTPDGSLLSGAAYSGNAQIALPPLPVSGNYRIRVMPYTSRAGSVSLSIAQNQTTAITPGPNSISVNLAAGQTVSYTFSGARGQALGLGLSNIGTMPSGQNVTFALLNSSGTQLLSYSTSGSWSYALPVLPVDDTYTLTMTAGIASASLSMTLVPDVAATLSVNGASTSLSNTPFGLNGSYTFAGVAGKSYSVLLTNDTFPGWPESMYVYIYTPDGSFLTGTYYFGNAQISLPPLPSSGNYLIRAIPTGPSSGSASFGVVQNATTAITPSAVPVAVSLATGQTLSYTFNGTQGENLGLGLTNIATAPSGQSVTYTLVNSSGTVLQSYSTSGASSYGLPTLPATGTYTLTLTAGIASANLNMLLVPDTSGELQVNGPSVTYANNPLGLNGSYTFSGLAGQNYTVTLNNGTYAGWPQGLYVSLISPEGNSLTSSSYAGNTQINLPSLPKDGKYVLRLASEFGSSPVSTQVSISTTLNAPATANGTLSPGSAAAVRVAASSAVSYSFTGSQGQLLGLSATNVSTSSGGAVLFTVTNSSGQTVGSFTATADTGFAIPPLPANDTYTVTISTTSDTPVAFNMQLLADVTGSLTLNGPGQISSSSVVGQQAAYSFTGTQGQTGLTLSLSGDSFAGAATVVVYNPDGSQLASSSIAKDGTQQLVLPSLPQSGNYVVRVQPGSWPGSLQIMFSQASTASLDNRLLVTGLLHVERNGRAKRNTRELLVAAAKRVFVGSMSVL